MYESTVTNMPRSWQAIVYPNKSAHLEIYDLVSHYCHRAILAGYLIRCYMHKEGRKEG